MPDKTDAKKILTAPPWKTGGDHQHATPRTMWMKTVRQDLKSSNFCLNEKLLWLRIVHAGDWCLRSVLCTASGACHKRRRCMGSALPEVRYSLPTH